MFPSGLPRTPDHHIYKAKHKCFVNVKFIMWNYAAPGDKGFEHGRYY